MIETDVESGLRWGELTELRVSDLDAATRMLTVSRAVVRLVHKFHPTGGRFLVKDYPKDRENPGASNSARTSPAAWSPTLKPSTWALTIWIFAIREPSGPKPRPRRPDPLTLGLSKPGTNDHRHWARYHHLLRLRLPLPALPRRLC